MHTDEPSAAVKRALLIQELNLWKNSRYQAEVRMRIARRIGGDAGMETEQMRVLEQCEKAIDVLQEELSALGPVDERANGRVAELV